MKKKKTKRKSKEKILTIGAHNDDYIVGAGGTLARYKNEGKEFYSIIFSFGELSMPHLKERVTVNMRVKESHRADRILGGSGVTYLGIKEGTFLDSKELAKDKLKKLIKEIKPVKIFTHSKADAHPDHRAVNTILLEVLDEISYKGEVFSFDVWNLFNWPKKDIPQLIVNIESTFNKKIEAFKAHKSQQVTIWTLLWNLYLKAIANGLRNGYLYCEVFDKIR